MADEEDVLNDLLLKEKMKYHRTCSILIEQHLKKPFDLGAKPPRPPPRLPGQKPIYPISSSVSSSSSSSESEEEDDDDDDLGKKTPGRLPCAKSAPPRVEHDKSRKKAQLMEQLNEMIIAYDQVCFRAKAQTTRRRD